MQRIEKPVLIIVRTKFIDLCQSPKERVLVKSISTKIEKNRSIVITQSLYQTTVLL